MKLLVFFILWIQTSVAQDIVLKSTFQGPSTNTGLALRSLESVDVNGDGNPEIPMVDNYYSSTGSYYYYLDTITFEKYNVGFYEYPNENSCISQARSNGLAEIAINERGSNGLFHFYVRDVSTQTYLIGIYDLQHRGLSVYDYDSDGLDDFVLRRGASNYEVYGVSNGNPVSPPQELDIQVSGDDYTISWSGVPSATAYRILWSSSIDGVSFTRIGYTTGTTFTHRNQADQPMGFYRVMSEDNGTGVVRMVGQTSGGTQ